MKKLLVGLTLLASMSSFSAEKPTSFKTTLKCRGTSGSIGVLGGSSYSCVDKNNKAYRVEGIGFGIGLMDSGGELILPILSLNPFGSIEGHYYGVDGSAGFESGVRAGALVGEFGAKWIPIGQIIGNAHHESAYGVDVRAMQFIIESADAQD